jgi:hypothetical protein
VHILMFLVHIMAFLSAYLHAYFEVFKCITIRSLDITDTELDFFDLTNQSYSQYIFKDQGYQSSNVHKNRSVMKKSCYSETRL